MSQPRTYVSSSGTLGSVPLTVRIRNSLSDYAEIAYLYFDTLITPILNPNANNLDSTATRPSGSVWRSGGGGGGDGGSAPRRPGGNPPRGGGGGGGFMSMGDINRPTVSANRSACCG